MVKTNRDIHVAHPIFISTRWNLLHVKHKYGSNKMSQVFGIKELYRSTQEPEVELVIPCIPRRS